MKRFFLGFNRNESIAVGFILLVLGTAIYSNLQVALRRSRDAQRKADVRAVSDALAKFQHDFAYFPISENGKIVACGGEQKDEKGFPILTACEWGWDSLRDVADSDYPAYLTRIPSDPKHGDGRRYYYLSNQKRFQIFASLEGLDEQEADPKIAARNLPCGNKICNFGLGYSETPTDITIEEYEKQLLEKQEEEN